MTTWCKMIGFFQMLEDSLCRNFSNITWRKQKNAPSNLQTDYKKTDTTPEIFQKKLQRIVYLCLCYGQASCWVSSQCKFSHFRGGFAVLQISTSSLLLLQANACNNFTAVQKVGLLKSPQSWNSQNKFKKRLQPIKTHYPVSWFSRKRH